MAIFHRTEVVRNADAAGVAFGGWRIMPRSSHRPTGGRQLAQKGRSVRPDTCELSLTRGRRSSPPGSRHAARPAEAPTHGVAVDSGRVRPLGGPQAAGGCRRRARLGPGSPRVRPAGSGRITGIAAADARCSAMWLHGAPKDARQTYFQDSEPTGGLVAASRVLYGWDGCSLCMWCGCSVQTDRQS